MEKPLFRGGEGEDKTRASNGKVYVILFLTDHPKAIDKCHRRGRM